MTMSIAPTLQNSRSVFETNNSGYCNLQWRRNQLLVKSSGRIKQPYMPFLETGESLKKCLKHSPVKLVRIEPKLGEEKIRLWADACSSVSKPIYLHIGAAGKQPKLSSPLLWWLKRLTELAIASVLLLMVSPLMLLLTLLIKSDAQTSIFEATWHVGERGRLFKLIKYRTMPQPGSAEEKTSPLIQSMAKYGLHKLPQLLNVIRGEMGLFGSRCWALEDAIKLNPEAQKQLNDLPGIAGSWEVDSEESNILHLDSQTS